MLPMTTGAAVINEHEAKVEAGLQDIGLGVNNAKSQITTIGVVGVVVLAFVALMWGNFYLLKDTISESRHSTKEFLQELKIERERQDVKWIAARDRSDMKHAEMIGIVKDGQVSIREVQKSVDKSVNMMDSALKLLMK